MRDLQSAVGAWHTVAFGVETTPALIRAMRDKLREEAAEADQALGLNDLAAELADVVIVCLGLAERLEIDLEDEVRAKLAPPAAQDPGCGDGTMNKRARDRGRSGPRADREETT